MSHEAKSSVCGRNAPRLLDFRCSYCGNPLEIRVKANFDIAKINEHDFSAWRYAIFFPYDNPILAVFISPVGLIKLVKLFYNKYRTLP